MPKVPTALLAEIKAASPIAAVLSGRGVELARQGRDLVCRCPLPGHEDREPSFHVTEADGESVAHCFGCDWAGNVFQLLQELDGSTFVEAVAAAASAVGVAFDAARYQPPAGRRARPGPGCPLDPETDDAALAGQIVAFYQQRLLRSDSAGWRYLAGRGLADMGLVRRYSLGYAERGALGRLLPDKQRQVGRALRSRLENLGWFKPGTGHEFFAGRVVVPVLDADGCVVGCYGRSLRPLKAEPAHKYQKGSHRGIWNAAAFAPAGAAAVEKTAILCEALLDGLTFARHGLDHVTTSYGVNGFLPAHLEAFINAGVRDIFVAYDQDDAGEKATAALVPELVSAGLTVYRVALPPGGDVNDLAVAAGDDAGEALRDALARSQWLGGARPVTVDAVPAKDAGSAEDAAPAESSSSSAATAPSARSAAASAAASPPVAGIDALEVKGGVVHARIGNRSWRILGLEDATTLMAIKTGLRVTVGDDYHQDRLDLANHRQRAAFAAAAAGEVPVQPALIAGDLKKLLLLAEERIEARSAAERAAVAAPPDPAASITPEERAAALALLRAPDLSERIVADLDACGLVGERVNKLAAYLAATSRKMARPLAILIQSSTAAGKTMLMDAIVDLMPEEDARRYSAISPKALYYLGQDRLKHQILAIAEEEGAEDASYSLKLLQSDGSLVFACPMKCADGTIRTEEVKIDGPIMLFLTTTKSAIADGELENRCVKLTVDENAAQTAAIHARQRQRDTWEGVAADRRGAALKRLHANAQRLLAPVTVVNPYAPLLSFATDRPRLRRDHRKYLDLIRAVTFLHQFQRPRETREIDGRRVEAVLTTPADIALANELAHVVLGRCLDDLPPQPRRLLGLLYAFIAPLAAEAGCPVSRFDVTIRQLQPQLPYGISQLRAHLSLLADHEYLAAYRAHSAEPMRYRLHFDEAPDERDHLCLGLIDPATICVSDDPLPGIQTPLPDRYRVVTGSLPGRYRVGENEESPAKDRENENNAEKSADENQRGTFSRVVVPKAYPVSAGA